MFEDLNPGIVIGGAAAAISVFAALAALYLWAVNRARQKFDPTADPQARAVLPWLAPLAPLLLPTFVILCLGMVAALAKAYEEKSWPEASKIVFTAWPAFLILTLWLKIRKINVRANQP
jgi:hypothetical protein